MTAYTMLSRGSGLRDPGAAVALGIRIKRVQGRLTAQAFAEALGVHPESMRRYLNGQGVPAMLLVRIAERFEVDETWLLTGRETPPSVLLSKVSTDRLLAELNRRATAEEHKRHAGWPTPGDDLNSRQGARRVWSAEQLLG